MVRTICKAEKEQITLPIPKDYIGATIEIFIFPIEEQYPSPIANPEEQRKRFSEDIEKRKKMGKPIPKIDEDFLASLEKGLPECSGVALGLDRLYMLALGKKDISEVLLFNCPAPL